MQKLTDAVTTVNAAPTKPNGSALNQLRTNEIAFNSAGGWELREFVLKQPNLVHDTIKQTPDDTSFNPSATLDSYMAQNAKDILCESYTVPLSFPGTTPFRGASVIYGSGRFWDWSTLTPTGLPATFPGCYKTNVASGFSTPPTPAQIASEVRHKFSLNTCVDCHAMETNTAFTHVSPLSSPATLSEFLTGTPIERPLSDPAGSGLNRSFNDLKRRGQSLADIEKSCLIPIINTTPALQAMKGMSTH